MTIQNLRDPFLGNPSTRAMSERKHVRKKRLDVGKLVRLKKQVPLLSLDIPLLSLSLPSVSATICSPFKLGCLTEKDHRLIQRVQEAIALSFDSSIDQTLRKELGVCHITRGTYVVKGMEQRVARCLHRSLQENRIPTLKEEDGIELPISPSLDIHAWIRQMSKIHTTMIAIFKPSDEVRGMPCCHNLHSIQDKDGIEPKDASANELIGMSLLQPGLSSLQIALEGSEFHPFYGERVKKDGVLLEFFQDAYSLLAISPQERLGRISLLPVQVVQDLALGDLALCNCDRSLENLLFSEKNAHAIYPIDHASILPRDFLSGGVFAWFFWAQARHPLTQRSLEKIRALNFEEDKAKILATYPQYCLESLQTMRLSYFLLERGAFYGLTPFLMAWMLKGREVEFDVSVMQQMRSSSQSEEEMKDKMNQCMVLLKHHEAEAVKWAKEDLLCQYLQKNPQESKEAAEDTLFGEGKIPENFASILDSKLHQLFPAF